MTERFLYRGTTQGWPGHPGLQVEHRTPTTTDPLIATLFAIECCRHGAGGLWLAPRLSVADLIVEPNCLSELEREIVLGILPIEFERGFTRHWVQAHDARSALEAMGLHVPSVISSPRRLGKELEGLPRLTNEQIAEFNRYVVR
jgi:hypothetical protein